MDGESPTPGYTALAERLLAHRLTRGDLSEAAKMPDAVAGTFRRLASVFALDHAAAAGEPQRAII